MLCNNVWKKGHMISVNHAINRNMLTIKSIQWIKVYILRNINLCLLNLLLEQHISSLQRILRDIVRVKKAFLTHGYV